ncbi:MAG: TonB-dependent receptor [Hyphomonadaceae bacterium]|nr:TonB-dependent receptor [Hyphomonadaceae bacterium]
MSSRILLGTAAMAVALSGQALAQDLDQPADDEIIVTGSRVVGRTVVDSPVPIDVISADALARSGATGGELGAALQSVSPSFNFQRQSNSGPADIVRAAQLRGLSPDQVLILVNGRRRHVTSVVNLESKIGRGTTPVDFNAIPLSAIERIEILRDGAGAQYGSDAIAGVINIILDDAPEGGAFSVSYGAHVTDFTYPVFSAPFTESGERTEGITDGETIVASLEGALPLGSQGFVRFGVEYRDRQQTERGGAEGGAFFIFPTPIGTGAANEALLNQRLYRPGDPESTDLSLWANAEYELANGIELYAFTLLSERDARGAAFFRYPDDTRNVPSVYPQGYRPVTTGESSDVSVSGGFRGDVIGWTYDASLTYGRNQFDFGVENSLNASFGAASPTRFHLAGYEFDQTTLNVDFARPLDWGIGVAPIAFAWGVELRRETFETTPGDPESYLQGPVAGVPVGAQAGPGLAPADTADSDRDVAAIYAEAAIQATDSLLIDLGARLEDYSDFGEALSGRIAGRYALTDDFALRGSISNSFRAPSLSQIDFAFSTTQFGLGGALQTVRTLPNSSPIARALGARDLEEESSTNYTLGFTAELGDHFTLTVDAFRIDISDRITLSERIEGGNLENFIFTNFGVADVAAVNFFTNAVDTLTEGFDIVATYRNEILGGDLALSAAYNRSETSIESVRPDPVDLATLGVTGTLFGIEERNTLTDAAPSEKFSFTADWRGDRLSLLSRVTWYGETRRVFNFGGGFEPEQTYGSETQLDLEAGYDINDNVRLSVGGANVLDNYPDRSNNEIFTGGVFPYDVISPIGLNGAYYYARLDVSF